MKKVILLILLFATIVSSAILGFKVKEYFDKKNSGEKDRIEEIDKKIKETEEKTEETSKEIEKIKEEKSEEVELMEEWQEIVKEIKGN